MELQAALESRYSCRRFEQAPLDHSQIEAVLEAARLAPTACNNQPQRLFVFTKPEDLEKLDTATHCRYGAPCVVAVAYDPAVAASHAMVTAEEDWSFGDLDTASTVVHMLLKATDLGLATCWLGAFSEHALQQAFPELSGLTVRALIDLGVPAMGPGPKHTDRRPLNQTATWM